MYCASKECALFILFEASGGIGKAIDSQYAFYS